MDVEPPPLFLLPSTSLYRGGMEVLSSISNILGASNFGNLSFAGAGASFDKFYMIKSSRFIQI